MPYKTVKKVAEIAKLNLSNKELENFSRDMKSILDAFKILDEVPENMKPAFHPVETKNITREDKVERSLTQEAALSNTKNKEKGYFKGPKVL